MCTGREGCGKHRFPFPTYGNRPRRELRSTAESPLARSQPRVYTPPATPEWPHPCCLDKPEVVPIRSVSESRRKASCPPSSRYRPEFFQRFDPLRKRLFSDRAHLLQILLPTRRLRKLL